MISGATALMLPSMMQPKEIMNVAMSGRRGSPLPWKNLRAGIRLSLAIACSSLGAPVIDWRPAPKVESTMPTRTMYSCGHDTTAESSTEFFAARTSREATAPYMKVVSR